MYSVGNVWFGDPNYYTNPWTTTTYGPRGIYENATNITNITNTTELSIEALAKLLEKDKQGVKVVENPEKNVKLPTFPHCNAYVVDGSSTLVLEFAVAGYSKDRISVTASKSNVLQIKATKTEKKEGITTIQTGISNKEFDITLQFDAAYDLSKSTVELVDGLLKISIPKAEGHEVKKLL